MLKIAFHPTYCHPLPAGHRFPMDKYDLLPRQLLYEGTCSEDNFFEPSPADEIAVTRVHSSEYYVKLKQLALSTKEARRVGFPMSEALVSRELTIAGGTMQCCDYAMQYGIAMNIAGGTHHAFSDKGEAFCMLNDQAIGARYVQCAYGIRNVLIIDLDVHQGNGTAEIFREDNTVFTFSMHGSGNYPFVKEQSDLDISLVDGSSDLHYLSILEGTLPTLFERFVPDFVFYLSGVDILSSDKLGRLQCTIEGCRARDQFVVQYCRDRGVPVQISMGGGYSPDIRTIVEAHANTFRVAQATID